MTRVTFGVRVMTTNEDCSDTKTALDCCCCYFFFLHRLKKKQQIMRGDRIFCDVVYVRRTHDNDGQKKLRK